MKHPLLVAAVLALAVAPGCQHPVIDAPNPQAIDAQRYAPAFEAAVAELRERGFTVDEQSYRFGRVTTRPKDAPTVAEPWTGDNTTLDQAWAATMNQMRRQVRVTLEPAEAGAGDDAEPAGAQDEGQEGSYLVRVEVLLEQRQLPVRRMTTATADPFTSLDAVPAELEERGVEGRYWEPIGRDPLLENRLLAAILERAGHNGDE